MSIKFKMSHSYTISRMSFQHLTSILKLFYLTAILAGYLHENQVTSIKLSKTAILPYIKHCIPTVFLALP